MIKVNKSTTLEDFYRQLGESVPLLFGKEVVVDVAASFAQQKLPHGLGRPYRGAVQIWASTLSRLSIHESAQQDDSDVNITVTDTVGVGGRVGLWVF